ncbi:MAG TPA: protein kinase [Candidatus Nitrosotalea sp.]|nr:protein kinase [Candidatus Nitrosotalea sp.]
MSLAAGTKLGNYEIAGAIGAGGMGEVYRATDTKLGREVAIKVLPAEFAKDHERVARFGREAQVLAALSHPNIAAIHGFLEANGVVGLVLELVDGPDLAERLKSGPVRADEAMGIARQIAAGLEAAHDRGIVHRDLKPANIKIANDGTVKILDFGLAKALEDTPAARDLSNSPTISVAQTRAGHILGTAAYMSPEQARGQQVDKRTDIWAFGAVLYEMLTGKKTFAGETVTDTLAAILTLEPDWNALPAATPAGIRALLHLCLERDAKKRLRDIGDMRLVLDAAVPAQSTEHVAPRASAWKRAVPWAVAILAALVAVALLVARARTEQASRGVMHVEVEYPHDVEPIAELTGGFALSPDGKSISMIGSREGARRLFVRRLDRPEASEVPDSSGASCATFSPDSMSVAFVTASGTLTRFSLLDQQRTIVATDSDINALINWGPTGIIYGKEGALWISPLDGGAARQLTKLDATRHEVLHDDPVVLPGGKTLLFSSMTTEAGAERIEAMPLAGGARTVVMEHAFDPVWSPTGHLLFGRDGAVWAVPFDPASASVRGTAVQVVPAGTVAAIRNGGLGFQVSASGTLLLIPMDFGRSRIMSVGRDGSELGLNMPPGRYGNPRLSPDGRRLMVENGSSEIEALDMERGTSAVLAAAALGTSFATWTADGKGVVFRRFNVPFWTTADGGGNVGTVPASETFDFPSAPGPDGDSILVVRIQPKTSGDIFLLSISGKFAPKPLVVTPTYDGGPQMSPDGHWLLYQSGGSGKPEIYVRRYPALDRAWTVSEGEGVQARWARTGKEIYYRNGHQMMEVTFNGSGAEPVLGKPVALFADDYDFGQGISIANYDVMPSGRFIMLRRIPNGGTFRVVMNWTEELKEKLASGGVH